MIESESAVKTQSSVCRKLAGNAVCGRHICRSKFQTADGTVLGNWNWQIPTDRFKQRTDTWTGHTVRGKQTLNTRGNQDKEETPGEHGWQQSKR